MLLYKGNLCDTKNKPIYINEKDVERAKIKKARQKVREKITSWKDYTAKEQYEMIAEELKNFETVVYNYGGLKEGFDVNN